MKGHESVFFILCKYFENMFDFPVDKHMFVSYNDIIKNTCSTNVFKWRERHEK